MAWNNPVIDGTNSVSSNKTPLNQNSAYIETAMQQDHYWDENANLDGRHKQVNMPDQSPDPSIGTDADGVIFHKEITKDGGGTTESVAVHKNSGSVNYLGIRAWVNFEVNSSGTVTIKSQYNVSSVARVSEGKYTVNFASNLPTRNYCVMGSVLSRLNRNMYFVLGNQSNNNWDTYQLVSSSRVVVVRQNGVSGTTAGVEPSGSDPNLRVTLTYIGG